jgi:hypothetical protein
MSLASAARSPSFNGLSGEELPKRQTDGAAEILARAAVVVHVPAVLVPDTGPTAEEIVDRQVKAAIEPGESNSLANLFEIEIEAHVQCDTVMENQAMTA